MPFTEGVLTSQIAAREQAIRLNAGCDAGLNALGPARAKRRADWLHRPRLTPSRINSSHVSGFGASRGPQSRVITDSKLKRSRDNQQLPISLSETVMQKKCHAAKRMHHRAQALVHPASGARSSAAVIR
jgi:hypothetical protein